MRSARLRSARLVGQQLQEDFAPAEVLRNVAYASGIDPQFPVFGTPTTQSVRDNFAAAKLEIEDLQVSKLNLSGGVMSGPIALTAGQIIDGGSFAAGAREQPTVNPDRHLRRHHGRTR